MNKEDYYHKKLEVLDDSDRIFDRPNLPKDPKKFHIVGICGTAMGSLAGLLREKGYEVSGSDQTCHPPISTMLDTLDVGLHTGNYEAKNIPEDTDVVVIGNVSTPTNPESKFARENKLPQVVLPEAFREYVFGDAKRIVVSGTHGKTTTTGITISIFETAGADPGYMVGGIPQEKERGFALGGGEYAIFEGDEYDTSYFNKMPKFLQYGAHTGIVTSVELDHLDIYSDFEDYKKAFEFFVEGLPDDGFLFVNGDEEVTRSLADKANQNSKVRTYGLKETNDVYAKNIVTDTENGTQTFDFIFDGENLGKIETSLSGLYNVANITASAGVGIAHGLPFEKVAEGVKNFKGMKRRQEIKGEESGIIVMDDFAHHPTAVRKTITGIKNKYPNKRLIVLFEPRSNSSRKKIFEQDYIESFDNADLACLKMPFFRHNDDTDDFIDAEKVVKEINNRGTEAYFYEDINDLLKEITPKLKSGDLVVAMSNGNFDDIHQKLLDKLAEIK